MSLEEKIDALITTLNRTVSTPAVPAGKEITAGAVGGFVSAVVDSTTKLMTGTYSLSAGLSDVSKTLGAVGGGIVGEITSVITKIGDSAIHINKALNEVAGSGVNFGNNIGKFTEDVVSARMSLPEFARVIAENGQKIAGLSGNAQKGAEAFLTIGKEFSESPAVRQLNAVGVGSEELNRVLLISATNRRGMDMTDKVVRDRVNAAAQDMAVEMDNVARLTGVSRQQQEKQIQDQMKKVEVELALASMSEQERAAYEKNITALGAYGTKFQDVMTIVATGGARNAEDNMKIAQMGPTFMGLVNELNNIKGNEQKDVERRRDVQNRIDAEALRIANDKAGLKTGAVLATGGGEYGRGAAEFQVAALRVGQVMQQAARDLDAENKKRADANEPRITLEQLQTARLLEEQKKREAALTSLEPGAIINRAEALIKDVSAGASKGLNDLNTGAKNAATGLNEFLKPLTKEDVIRKFSDLISNINSNAVDSNKLSDRAKAAEEAAKAKKPGEKAEGGGMFGNMPYLVGEDGPEIGSFNKDSNLLSNKNLRSLFGEADTDLRNATSNLQSEMRSKIADLKSSTLTAGQLEEAMSRVTAALPKQLPQMPQDNTASNELIKHVQQLNTQVRELITAVVDGSSANVKAVRTSGGNMIA
jgi:hypothetical protein